MYNNPFLGHTRVPAVVIYECPVAECSQTSTGTAQLVPTCPVHLDLKMIRQET